MIVIVMFSFLIFMMINIDLQDPSSFGFFSRLFNQGGFLMWPLLGISLLSLTITIERTFFWMRMSQVDWLDQLAIALRNNSKEDLSNLIEEHSSPYIDIVNHLLANGSEDSVVLEIVEQVRPQLDKWLVTLSSIITAAPLVGILGTVIGIIQSFSVLSTGEAIGDPTAVSGGISTALVTTAFGLLIALAAHFPYMAFRLNRDRALSWIEVLVAAAQEREKNFELS
tara:strand:- start:9 stop:683 length:675 start_codon:yes stop_codon:yes gene_type:complete